MRLRGQVHTQRESSNSLQDLFTGAADLRERTPVNASSLRDHLELHSELTNRLARTCLWRNRRSVRES